MLSCCLFGSIYVDFTQKSQKSKIFIKKLPKKTSGKNANIRHRWSARRNDCKKLATAATSTGFMTHLKELALSAQMDNYKDA